MAVRRGICPVCKATTNFANMVFPVNDKADRCFCPRCLKELKPIEAIQKYEEALQKKIKEADKTLYLIGDADKAYRMYGDIISLDDSYLQAYLGRFMALIYHSTVRRSYIYEATLLMSNEVISIMHKSESKNEYVAFISRAIKTVDEYFATVKKRIIFRKYFYEPECIEIYYKLLKDIYDFKKLLLGEAQFLSRHSDIPKANSLVNQLTNHLEDLDKKINQSYITVYGEIYHIGKIKRNGDIVIEKLDDTVKTNLHRYHMATLDQKNKKLRQIDDIIFKNYRSMMKVVPFASIISGASLLAALILGLMTYLYRESDLALYIFMTSTAIALILSISFLIVIFVFRGKIALRRKKLKS